MESSEPKYIMRLYRESVKNVPLLKYTWVIISTICLLALAAYFELENSHVFLYAFGVLLISFFGFVFSFMLKKSDTIIRVALYILIYCIIATTGTAVVGFGSFIIWQKPSFYEKWFPNNKNSNEEEVQNLPGETGWIFAGYYNVDKGYFTEGPYVAVENTTMRGMRQFIEKGDIIKLKVKRKLIIVDYQKDSTTKNLLSPINKGIIDKNDETGITLKAGSYWLVRDVSEGKWEDSTEAAIWLRLVNVPK